MSLAGYRVRMWRGIVRSLRTYRRNRNHAAAMDRFYVRFVREGDLVFDVGAHVGDRIACFRRLGARVVAVEPQPALARLLRMMHWRDRDVVIEPVAAGRNVGETNLHLNIDNPTVSTASTDFVEAARGAPGWESQVWSRTVSVPMTTLDTLIARHGHPAFIKIDVEGFEAESLAGLTQAVKALSFEFTTIQRDVALACIRHCTELGLTRFNAALGESQQLVHPDWVDGPAISRWLRALPHAANSGDIYAMSPHSSPERKREAAHGSAGASAGACV